MDGGRYNAAMSWHGFDSNCCRCELYVLLDQNGVLVGPIDPVGVSTILVVPNPMSFYCLHVQLQACVVVHPYTLAPLGHASEVWFLTMQSFVWPGIA